MASDVSSTHTPATRWTTTATARTWRASSRRRRATARRRRRGLQRADHGDQGRAVFRRARTSDIAEGIYYAVAQGADVINMCFGGYARSQVEEDALAVAFGQACWWRRRAMTARSICRVPIGRNVSGSLQLGAGRHGLYRSRGGPAAGRLLQLRLHRPRLARVRADGPRSGVWSTLPNDQYAAWDGTSMAAPVVSGIAALARNSGADKDVYSSRFIMGQIAAKRGRVAGVANANAPDRTPKPELSYLEHWIFDTTAQAANNDNDGIVDAGETVDLAIVIRNHWGKADHVTVTLEAWADGAFQPDPYVTMITNTVDYGAIGSFNSDDNGLIYDGKGSSRRSKPIPLQVAPNTPNNHVIPFRVTMTAGNGYDPADPNAPNGSPRASI